MHEADREFLENTEEMARLYEQELRLQGLAQGLAPLVRQIERKVKRKLTEADRETLLRRLKLDGPELLGDLTLDLDGPALDAWLHENDS